MSDHKEVKIHPKHLAREYVVQALYQQQMNGDSVATIVEQFVEAKSMPKPVYRMFKKYSHEIIEHQADILETLAPQVRSIEEIHVLTLAILMLAIYELKYCFDVPYKAVINEAIELAKSLVLSMHHNL